MLSEFACFCSLGPSLCEFGLRPLQFRTLADRLSTPTPHLCLS